METINDPGVILADIFAQPDVSTRLNNSRFLGKVMAAILQLFDNISTETKLSAVEYLQRTLEVAPAESLEKLGYLDVSYDALFRCISFKEPKLLAAVYSSLISVLKLQKILQTEQKVGRLNNDEAVLLQSLKNLYIFSEKESRLGVLNGTEAVMEYMGLRSGKFLPRMLDVTDMLVQSGVEQQQLMALGFISTAARSCWPLFPNHMDQIVLQVMKIVLDRELTVDSKLYEEICGLFTQLRRISDGAVVKFVSACLEKEFINEKFSAVMRKLLTDTELDAGVSGSRR